MHVEYTFKVCSCIENNQLGDCGFLQIHIPSPRESQHLTCNWNDLSTRLFCNNIQNKPQFKKCPYLHSQCIIIVFINLIFYLDIDVVHSMQPYQYLSYSSRNTLIFQNTIIFYYIVVSKCTKAILFLVTLMNAKKFSYIITFSFLPLSYNSS